EFGIAIAELFGLAALTGGDLQNVLENLPALVLDGDAVQHIAAIDVHVAGHALIDRRVGGKLDRGRGLAAIGRAAASGEAEDIGAARDLAGGRDGVIAGRVHEDEALGGHGFRIFIDRFQARGAALGGGAQRLFQNRGEAARLVPRRRIVVHATGIAVGVILPPADALDQLLADVGRGT